MQVLKVTFLLALIAATQASSLDFDALHALKCSVWDSACLVSLAQLVVPFASLGFPEINVPALDPMHVPLIEINQGGLKAEVDHIIVEGFSKTIVTKFSLDKYSKQARVRVIIPDLNANATYKAAGYLHTLPFNGKGRAFLNPNNVEIDAIVEFDVREDGKGKKYAELKKYFYSFEVQDDIMVLFSDLYFGDQAQSAATHSYIQKHWKLITAEYGRPLLTPLTDRVYNAIKIILHSVPLDTFVTDF